MPIQTWSIDAAYNHTRLCHQVPVLPPSPLQRRISALRAGQGVALCRQAAVSAMATHQCPWAPLHKHRTVSRRHTAGRSWSGTPPQASSLSAAKSTTGLLSTRWKRSWRPLTPGWSIATPSACCCVCATVALLPGGWVPRRASPLPVAPAPLVPAQGNGAVLPSRPVTRRLPGSLRGLVPGGALVAEPADIDSSGRERLTQYACGRLRGCCLNRRDM